MKAATVTGVYGKAGHGLTDARWAANETVAKIGQKAELKTATLLQPFGRNTAIIHDVRVPIPNFTSNIDHVIVSGRNVYLIDTKAWKSGWYWSISNRNMHNLKPARESVSKSPDYMVKAFQKHLGSHVTVHPVTLAVWPSARNGKVVLLNPSVYNCRVLPAEKLPAALRLRRAKPGDAATVTKLKKLSSEGKNGS